MLAEHKTFGFRYMIYEFQSSLGHYHLSPHHPCVVWPSLTSLHLTVQKCELKTRLDYCLNSIITTHLQSRVSVGIVVGQIAHILVVFERHAEAAGEICLSLRSSRCLGAAYVVVLVVADICGNPCPMRAPLHGFGHWKHYRSHTWNRNPLSLLKFGIIKVKHLYNDKLTFNG